MMLDAHISTVFNGNCHKFHYNLFCEQVFYYFYHIYLIFFFFQLRVQTFFWGVQCMLMHPRRTGPGLVEGHCTVATVLGQPLG